MRTRLLKLGLIILTVLPFMGQQITHAQNTYQLRHLTASEFAARLAEVLPPQMARDDPTLLPSIEDEFLARDSVQDAKYADMLRLYAFLKDDNWVDYGPLNRAMIAAWLNENQVDLDKVKHLQFDHYTIQVTPRDFKGDGGHEWLLTIETIIRAYNPIENYLIAEQTSRGYRLIETPLPWRGETFYSYTDWRGGTTQPLFFGDLNGDGVPEWVVALGGVGGDFLNWGQLYVMEWVNGQMVDVSALIGAGFDDRMSYASPGGGGAPVFPSGISIEFVKSLTQNALDIVIRHQTGDNWGCTWTDMRTYSWSGETYRPADTQRLYADSQGCQWRDAEAAFWVGDLKTAIAHYERGLALNWWDYNWSIGTASAIELTQYARIRLAIAYSLDGQTDKTRALMAALRAEKPESDLMGQLIAAMTSGPGNDPFTICMATYGVFQAYLPSKPDEDASYDMLPTRSLIGNTWDNNGWPWRQFSPPSPARAGCDPRLGLQYLVDHTTFRTDSSPTERLAELGVKTTAALKMDMNGDGHAEWVISTALQTPPVFFAPRPDHTYRVAFVPVDGNSSNISIAVRPLPEHAGLALVTTSARHTDLTCPPIYEGGLLWPKPEVFLDVWRLQAGVLVNAASIPLCDLVAFETTWSSNNHEVDGWAPVTHKAPGNPTDLGQAPYTWDSIQQKYLPPDQVDQPSLSPDPYPISWWDFRSRLNDALSKKQYDKALILVDATLARPFDAFSNSDTDALLHYWRGLVLELRGDSAEAVREYVTLYETGPQSAWGKLAMLHLEMVF